MDSAVLLFRALTAMSWILIGLAQNYPPEETYQDAAPENMIPSVPWPEWLPQDLSSIPRNLPRPGTWQPKPRSPNGQSGSSDGGGGGGGGLGGMIKGLFQGPAPPQVGPPGSTTASRRRFPRGDPRNCIREGDTLNIMQVVPGLGWDNLRNIETGMITSFSYHQCKVTSDRKYLLPDHTFSIPIKSSRVERNSEYIENWDTYKSITSRSINTGFDFFGIIGGKFSNEYRDIKSRMFNEKAIAMRMELRHRFHTIKQLPDSKLHPSFKTRLLDILSLIKSNDTAMADYATQLLVRDYGTHYLVSVDAGAVLTQEDNLKSTIKSSYKGRTNSITAAGGADFFDVLSIRGGYANYNGHADLTAYRSHRTSSKLVTYGGPPFRLGMNVTEWELNLANNLVAVDRVGRPLHSIITTENMKPEVINTAEIGLLKERVTNAIRGYYDFNTRLGCTDVNAPNFDYQANSPLPGSCMVSSPNFTLGGIFQTCLYYSHPNGMCKNLAQKNPLTGDNSCPDGYNSVLLLQGHSSRPKTDKKCKMVKKCKFWFFGCRHEQQCQFFQNTEKVVQRTYWCAPVKKKSPNSGYMFGGIYASDLNNPITRGKTCPKHFITMNIGSHAKICLSEDYELGRQFSLPFGGFFSCKSGNKLASENASDFLNNPRDWPMQCPGGFTQHLALTDNDCRVNYCVKAGVLLRAQDLDIVLPPFNPRPAMKQNSTMDMFEAPNPNFGTGFANAFAGSPPESPVIGSYVGVPTMSQREESNGGKSIHCTVGLGLFLLHSYLAL